jgi:1,4-alpha-glucan branching enzyme
VPNLTDIALETLDLGAQLRGGTCHFKVWAPKAKQVVLRLNGRASEMRAAGNGYFETDARAAAGDKYF